MLPEYRFKFVPELMWSVLTAGAVVLLLALVGFQPDAISDPKAYAVALGGAMVRSMAGAALDFARRQAMRP